MERTGCVVVGGGPAGLVLGLLLARAGVAVTVLEKHADFLRDFRGDTVHASTLTLLDELGLGERFAALPQRRIDRGQVHVGGSLLTVADLRRLPGAHQHIALVPQWDFLELLAAAAAEEPTFTLRRNAEVTRLVHDGGRVAGVGYRDRATGAEHELRAGLVVGCDGRDSAVRAAAGLRPRTFGAPIDVEWFRLPRADDDPAGAAGWVGERQLMIMIDRGDYWQCGYVIGKGRGRPAAGGRDRGVPGAAGRAGAVARRPGRRGGLVRRGQAAQRPAGAAAPVVRRRPAADRGRGPRDVPGRRGRDQPGGAGRGRRGPDPRAGAAGGFRGDGRPPAGGATASGLGRRADPGRPAGGARGPGRSAGRPDGRAPAAARDPVVRHPVPLPLRLLSRFPVLQGLPARAIAIGPRPEHAPEWARRPSSLLRAT